MTDLYRASDVIMNLFLDVPTQTVAVPIQLVTWTSSLYSKVHHSDIDSSCTLYIYLRRIPSGGLQASVSMTLW
jgi:hypothetical protein